MREDHILRTIKHRVMTSKSGPMGQEVIAGEENYIMRTVIKCTSNRETKSSVTWKENV
jgi:hypothetical protein